MSESGIQLPALILVRDLIFASRIRATAESLGVSIIMMSDPNQLGQASGRRLIVDLNQPGAIDAAAAWGRTTGRPVVGFVSHVDSAAIDAARAAGIQQVLARSGFVEILPDLLR